MLGQNLHEDFIMLRGWGEAVLARELGVGHVLISAWLILYSLTGIFALWHIQIVLETFRALADPSRLQILDLLLREPLSVGSVAERLCIRQPQASKHLRALSEAGLVEVHPDAQRRIYALRAQPFQELDGWLEHYRNTFEQQFKRLDQVLEELQTAKKPIQKKVKTKRSPR
jgi:DNA-binding transcriptional ArsR family regulator